MSQYEIIFYEKEDKSEPAREFIDTLPDKAQARVSRIMNLLENDGPDVGMPYSEYLQDGIFQIRVNQNSLFVRVLYFFFDGKKIVFTNGFLKKTNKTPTNEIEKAKKYRADYKNRK